MELKIWKFIWLLLTNGFFRWELAETLKWAVSNQQVVRGDGTADVLTFEIYFYNKVVKNKIST